MLSLAPELRLRCRTRSARETRAVALDPSALNELFRVFVVDSQNMQQRTPASGHLFSWLARRSRLIVSLRRRPLGRRTTQAELLSLTERRAEQQLFHTAERPAAREPDPRDEERHPPSLPTRIEHAQRKYGASRS